MVKVLPCWMILMKVRVRVMTEEVKKKRWSAFCFRAFSVRVKVLHVEGL